MLFFYSVTCYRSTTALELMLKQLPIWVVQVGCRSHLTVGPENVLFRQRRTIGKGVLDEWN